MFIAYVSLIFLFFILRSTRHMNSRDFQFCTRHSYSTSVFTFFFILFKVKKHFSVALFFFVRLSRFIMTFRLF